MTHIIPFSFDHQSIRVVEQDGEPWFVLADVCKALDLQNPSATSRHLAEDQKAKFKLGFGSDAIIVSESGLYLIVMRSDDAIKPGTVAYRFTRWVTGEVIPSIRKTGSYNPMSHIDPTPSLTDGISAVRETRFTWGKPAAREMWIKMGLPTVPSMFAQPPQLSFFVAA
ncbi:BRO-N domain-containing protein [Sphingomonas aquatilis]